MSMLLASIGSYIKTAFSLLWIKAPAGTINHVVTTAARNDTLYVASNSGLGASTTYLSTDGISWSTTLGKTNGFRGLFWDSTFGKFYAGEGTGGRISTTVDGVSWSVAVVGSARWNGFARNTSRLVAVGNSRTVATSTNGTSWTAAVLPISVVDVFSVIWDQTRSSFFIAGTNSFLHSADGITWINAGTTTGIRRSVAANSSIIVQVGDSGAIYTSTTGTDSGSWVQQVSGTSASLYSVIWTGSQFIAVGDSGTLISSSDGVTWARETSNTTNNLRALVQGPSRIVALGSSELVYANL